MQQAYLDNAATTPIDEQVIDTMTEVMRESFGNPSSIHHYGRKARTLVEQSRKTIAQLLGAAPGEIFFTSGGTESDNLALRSAVFDLDCQHIVTTAIEHDAVLKTAQYLAEQGHATLHLLPLQANGHIDMASLEKLLKEIKGKALVSLMHANNEIGNLLDIESVGQICKEYGAIFHSDTVQTIGHLPVKPKEWKIDFLAGSAHKFHGPKGVGFIFINEDISVKPLILGGSQERNMRGGTENLVSIVGMAKALEIGYAEMQHQQERISGLKHYMADGLKKLIPGIAFNGDCLGRSNFTVLNASFPLEIEDDMMLFNLDIAGIAASGGSACSSGSNIGSHVLAALKPEDERINVRFSFGKFTTQEEIDYTLQEMAKFLPKKVLAT